MEDLENHRMQDVRPHPPPPPETAPVEKDNQAGKQKERASSLCKTPPSLIRSKNNGAEFHRGMLLGEVSATVIPKFSSC